MKQIVSLTIIVLTQLVLTGPVSTCFAQSSYNPMLNAQEQAKLAAGEIIMREIETEHDKGQAIETIGLIKASGDTLVHILTDYEAYPLFMSAVDQVEIVDQAGDETTLNYILSPMLGLVKKYRIKIAPTKLDEQVGKIEWYLVEWPGLTRLETIGDTQGYWLIIEQSQYSCLVQYYVYSDPSPVPFGLGGLVDALGRDSIEDVFNETRERAETMMDNH